MYSYKDEQKKIDEKKWKESYESGEDKCGSYDYCSECKKESGKTRVAVLKSK